MKGGDEETLTHEEANRILAWHRENRGDLPTGGGITFPGLWLKLDDLKRITSEKEEG